MITIDIANEANDNWIMKANPDVQKQEIEICNKLIEEFRAKEPKKKMKIMVKK